MRFFRRLICAATEHEFVWQCEPAAWGGPSGASIMRGTCRRCDEQLTAPVAATANWFFAQPGLAGRFPSIAAYMGTAYRATVLAKPSAEIIPFPLPPPNNVIPFPVRR